MRKRIQLPTGYTAWTGNHENTFFDFLRNRIDKCYGFYNFWDVNRSTVVYRPDKFEITARTELNETLMVAQFQNAYIPIARTIGYL